MFRMTWEMGDKVGTLDGDAELEVRSWAAGRYLWKLSSPID